MAKLLDLSVYGPGHISNILQVDASVYAKAFVTDGGKDTQVVRGDGTLASISSLYVGNAATATNAPWSGITGKPTTFTPSAHTHTASDITGLPTSLKNPYKLTFGSKTYDGSAAATITASDLGALTSITKSMVEGVLTGNITSHRHTQYLTSALIPAKFSHEEMFPPGYFIIKINNNTSEWMLSFDVKIVVSNGSYTIRFSEDNRSKSESWSSPSASMIDGEDSVKVKFGYSRTNKWVAITTTDSFAGVSITNVANGYAPIDTYALDKLFTITFWEDWGVLEGDDSGLGYLGTVQETITIYPPSKEGHTHTASDVTGLPTALKNPYAVEIKANGVSLGTYDGSAAATFNLSAANVGAANKVHTHTASEISGLSTNLSSFTNDVGFITGITKSMVEGVLTGNITSHTHSFTSLTSKPTTLSGYGITDALTRKKIIYKEDYQKYVILLCKVGTNTTNIGHTINGTFWANSNGAVRYQAAYINVHCSDWKEGHNEYYGFTPFGLGNKCRLVTCTYQSSQYLAITFENVHIEPAPAETKTVGGIIIPDTAKEKPLQGTIVAVGQGTKDEEMVLKEGDKVLYGKYAGTELEHEGKKYLIMRQSDVVAILG